MIKFDLEKALNGEEVVTRDGREIVQLYVFNTLSGDVIYGYDIENDHVEQWFVDGNYHKDDAYCGGDLFMAPKKLSGFIAIFHNGLVSQICRTKELAMGAHARAVTGIIDLSQFEEGEGL